MIEITPELQIPESEISYTASRSGGPGGQNVNKVNSKVTLLFDVRASVTLSDEQKEKILSRLATRINSEGVMQVASQAARSQFANRELATARFAELLRAALAERKKRKKTRVSASAKAKRLDSKKKHGAKKALRKGDFD